MSSHKLSNPPSIGIFFGVVGIVTVRVLLEWFVFEFPIQLDVVQDYIRFYLENFYYFLILFYAGVWLIAWLLSCEARDIMRFGLKLYPVIWLPPIIDGLVLGRTEGYYYAVLPHAWDNLFTVFLAGSDASPGIKLEIVMGLAGVTGYVFWKSRSWLKALFALVVFDVLLVFLSTPDLVFGPGRSDYRYDYFLPLFYFFPFLAMWAARLFVRNRENFFALLGNLRPMRAMMFVLAVLAGGVVRHLMLDELNAWNLTWAVVAAFFYWQVSVMVNDIYDVKIDRISNPTRPLVQGRVSAGEMRYVSLLLTFAALSFAAVTGLQVLLLTIIVLLLAHIYSQPPLRLRDDLWGNVVIGLALSISFVIGLLASQRYFLGHNVFTDHVLLYSALIFLFGTAASMGKDIKDIEGDRQAGVRNVFTLFGRRKGKQIIALLLALVFGLPVAMTGNGWFLLPGAAAVLIFLQRGNFRVVYLISAGVLVAVIGQLNAQGRLIAVDPPLVQDEEALAHFGHNTVQFIDGKGRIRLQRAEINGWVLLEGLLKKYAGNGMNVPELKAMRAFNNYRGVYGWWPEKQMILGNPYFPGKPRIYLPHDSNDTAWYYKLSDVPVPGEVIARFLSDQPLPPPFDGVCARTDCRRDLIVRIWDDPWWHDEVDLAAMANAVTALEPDSQLNADVFEANARFINAVLEAGDPAEFLAMWDPEELGAAMILLYDEHDREFLTPAARANLTFWLRDAFAGRRPSVISSRWMSAEDGLFGVQVIFENRKLPEMIRKLAQPLTLAGEGREME